jgi:ring-1,2-phenylacetyl-CoA epoxidase subunit PaaA
MAVAEAPQAHEEFAHKIRAGRGVEAWDWMPDDYRSSVIRMAGQQAIAEVVGAQMFSEWLDAAPTLERKAMLMAKVQDEIGHGHVMLRICEDLGKSREEILGDYIAGRTNLLNTFHYSFQSWPEIAGGRIIMTGAALVQFKSLVRGSYLPYTRALKKILKEESFHYHEAIDLAVTLLARGTAKQKAQLQEGIDLWYPRMLAYFGPPDSQSTHSELMMGYRLKMNTNDDMRQEWLSKVVPLVRSFGLTIPDEQLAQVAPGMWTYTQPDWAEVKAVIKGGGPASELRRERAARYYDLASWVSGALSTTASAA